MSALPESVYKAAAASYWASHDRRDVSPIRDGVDAAITEYVKVVVDPKLRAYEALAMAVRIAEAEIYWLNACLESDELSAPSSAVIDRLRAARAVTQKEPG